MPEPDDLLADVLAESAPADFRAALLGDTLRRARRRRWRRHAGRGALAAAMACIVGLLVWRSAPRDTLTVSTVAGCEIVRTQPLAAEAIVHTRPLGAARWVATFASVAEVRTAPAGDKLQPIDDDELLALAAPRLAALVRVGPGAQELIFVETPEPGGAR